MTKKRMKQSIVLSVSLMKGCYRHIQLSVNETLEDLADTILWAFDFYNDHAHAFWYNISIVQTTEYGSDRLCLF